LAAPTSHILYPGCYTPFVILRALRVLRGDNCSLVASAVKFGCFYKYEFSSACLCQREIILFRVE